MLVRVVLVQQTFIMLTIYLVYSFVRGCSAQDILLLCTCGAETAVRYSNALLLVRSCALVVCVQQLVVRYVYSLCRPERMFLRARGVLWYSEWCDDISTR